jgi:hypothetical protein
MRHLAIAAAFGLLASGAMAECMTHMPLNASVEVDRMTTTASISTTDVEKDDVTLVLHKRGRLSQTAQAVE